MRFATLINRVNFEVRLRRSDGIYRWFLIGVNLSVTEPALVVRWYATAVDIENRKQTETLRVAEKQTLKMIADNASLKDILNHLCTCIDVQVWPSVTTVLLMDPEWDTALAKCWASDPTRVDPCNKPSPGRT